MRIVFTCVPVASHFYPLVAVARAVADAGHDVTFVTHESLAPTIQQAGFRHRAAGLDFFSPEITALRVRATELHGSGLNAYSWGSGFAGVLAQHMARDLAGVPEVRQANLLVREITELGGCVVAERLGIPHAAISILSLGMTPGARDWIAEPLNALRAEHGLPSDPDVLMPFRYLTIYQAPRRFLTAHPLPTDRVIRPEPFDRADGDVLPTWVDALPVRPTVYASLGTVFNNRPEILSAFIEGLRDEPLNLIVTVGRDQDPARFGPQLPNVRIERYIPQSLLLPRCDLVLTHGGSGTVMSALTHGLPLVVVPLGADQPENAARCVALGVGEALTPDEVTPMMVRAAVRTVLGDPSYRRIAEVLQGEIRALPGSAYAVEQLERLVHDHRAAGGDVVRAVRHPAVSANRSHLRIPAHISGPRR